MGGFSGRRSKGGMFIDFDELSCIKMVCNIYQSSEISKSRLSMTTSVKHVGSTVVSNLGLSLIQTH